MGKKKSEKNSSEKPLELYTAEQVKIVEEHIEKYFGEIRNVFSEKNSEYIKLNINVIPPSRKNPYYTLVTSGMGAHFMKVPSELKDKHLERAELVLCLSPDWDLNSEELEYYWPLKLLSLLSRLPIEENSWLGWGHTVNYGSPFADNTEFCGAMIIYSMFGKESVECKLSDDEKIWFYQVLPLYRNEMNFKHKYGASALIRKFTDKQLTVADIERPCLVPENFMELIDSVEDHSRKIKEKNLDILEINGANHISAFLRWFLEHDMLNDDFLEFFEEDIELIKSEKYDIRKFLINSLGGELTTDILKDEGRDFAHFYYSFYCEPPSYPNDVDKMAEEYFGTERYKSDEFSDEAYLFVPFDKDYISAMYKYIDHAYSDFYYFKEHKKLPDEETDDEDNYILDCYENHAKPIDEKGLKISKINAVNHIVAFLKWCIKHELMCEDFMGFYSEFQEDIESGKLDMREFFTDNLDGELNANMFNEKGQLFCYYYYDFTAESDEPCYPEDVDRMALDYFGEDKYNSDEFQDEAYLFVPFNDDYFTAINRYIEKNFEEFLEAEKNSIIDAVCDRSWKIEDKNLDIPEKNCATHMAVFLKWCIEHNLMSDNFVKFYADYREKIEDNSLDMRDFIITNLKGEMNTIFFNAEGRAFCEYYYEEYYDDVDKAVLDYFGEDKFHSEKYQNEAYLFVPFNKTFFKILSRYINKAYRNFKKLFK